MAGPVSRTANTVEKEILKFPAGLDAIDSVVLSAAASGVDELPSATVGYAGKLGLLAGTILKRIDGDDQKRYARYDGTGEVAGILGDNIYFVDDTDNSDKAADMLNHGCVFNKDKIIDFDAFESDVRDAMPSCRFDEHYPGVNG